MDNLEPKKLALLRILQIFQRYSDYNHPLTQDKIIEYLEKDYGIKLERKAVSRNISMLKEAGYAQYEISNFSRPGYESRHNLKYWNDDEYLGLGAAAHGFYAGRRYFHNRDIEAYISGERPTDDGEGGDREEYAMLRLRLANGITETGWNERFSESIPQSVRRAAERLQKGGLVVCDDMGIRLTGTGFPVSNAVIAELTMKL